MNPDPFLEPASGLQTLPRGARLVASGLDIERALARLAAEIAASQAGCSRSFPSRSSATTST
jgi:hypothetical protein